MNVYYQCTYCGKVYERKDEALRCEEEAQKIESKFKLDDIVLYSEEKHKVIGIQREFCYINPGPAGECLIPTGEPKHDSFEYKLVSLEAGSEEKITDWLSEDELAPFPKRT